MTWVVYHKRWMLFPFVILVVLLALFQSSYSGSRAPSNIAQKIESSKVISFEAETFKEKSLALREKILNLRIEGFSDLELKDFQDSQLAIIDRLSPEDVSNNLNFINVLEKKYDFRSKKIEQDITQGVTVKNKSDLNIDNTFITKISYELDKQNTIIDLYNNKVSKYDDIAAIFPPLVYTYNPVLDYLNVLANHIGAIRYDWVRVVLMEGDVGSSIDTYVQIYDFYSVLRYLPRAIQIGFLSPFPKDFLVTGNSVGKIGYILSGGEMLLWYFIFFGFIYSMFFNLSIFRQLIPVFIFSFTIIILLAYVVPVIGALFRMRQGYMIPIYIYGMYGLQLIYNRFSLRFLHPKY